ncbi:MAG: phospholipase D family protein, partial [Flavobacterium sp.]
ASEAGILGLAEHIVNAKKYFKTLNLIVGVDQGKTSKEALWEINNLNINSYIFHQAESAIFHPKIYLIEGARETKLILGSSNMTARGLFGNVESSLLFEFRNSNKQGKDLLKQIKDYYSALFNFTDPNLFKISEKTIRKFIDCGIVPNETTVARKYGKRRVDEIEVAKKSDLIIPKRVSPKVPDSFKSKPISSKEVAKIIDELEISNKI